MTLGTEIERDRGTVEEILTEAGRQHLPFPQPEDACDGLCRGATDALDLLFVLRGLVLRRPFWRGDNGAAQRLACCNGVPATNTHQDQNKATFVVRFSAHNPHCLATAHVGHNGQIIHSLIEKTKDDGGGYRVYVADSSTKHGPMPLFTYDRQFLLING